MKQIILFGFSGSGKSTLAREVAKEFNLRVLHPSSLIKDIYEGREPDSNNTQYNNGFWESAEGFSYLKKRLNDEEPVDLIVDKILLSEFSKGDIVVDSWNLPWLTSQGYRVYLQANISPRANRVAQRSKISIADAYNIVSQKDEDTRQLFLTHYGFDIKYDHSVFNKIITTDNMTFDEVKKQVFDDINGYLSSL